MAYKLHQLPQKKNHNYEIKILVTYVNIVLNNQFDKTI